MGWQRSTLHLTWDDSTEWAGLELTMRRLSIGELVAVTTLSDSASTSLKDDLKLIDDLAGTVSSGLLEWNFTREERQDDGSMLEVPVPTTVEGVKSADMPMLLAITGAWIDLATQVKAPLRKASPSGGLPPGLSSALVDASVSLPN